MKEGLFALLSVSFLLLGCAGGGAGISSGEIPPDEIGFGLEDDGTSLPQAVPSGTVSSMHISDEDLALDDLYIDLGDDSTALPEAVS